jgi:hypothetical protein
MRSLILERMIWFQAGSITYQLRKHGRLGIQAQPCGTRRCPSSSSKHSNDSTMCSCSESRSLLASLTNRRRPARHGRPCGGAASACGPTRHRAIARVGGVVAKTDKRLRELEEAVPFLFNMCEYLPQQKWVRGVIYGGGAELGGRCFDIALPVLAGEHRAAMLTPVGCRRGEPR